jgi:hypothetical protein
MPRHTRFPSESAGRIPWAALNRLHRYPRFGVYAGSGLPSPVQTLEHVALRKHSQREEWSLPITADLEPVDDQGQPVAWEPPEDMDEADRTAITAAVAAAEDDQGWDDQGDEGP